MPEQARKKLAQHTYATWVPVLDGEPIAPRLRVLTPIQEAQAAAQAMQWLDKGVIEPIPNPPLVNNLVLVAKKDGRIRVCVDCTPANQVTKDFTWPLPRLQDIRARIRGNTWFSRLDLKDAFFRIGVPRSFRHLTAFRVGSQAYQFTRMPFGLKTAPSVFQRFMDWGLSQYVASAYWYIDDILVMAQTRSELVLRERAIRRRLHDMGCEINEDKSVSLRRELLFAGVWVCGEGVGPNKESAEKLLALPTPRTKAEAQSALGLVSYLRDFVPLVGHFTAMLYPDKDGLRLDKDEYERQWQALIRHLVSSITITRHWKNGVPADLYTDASQYALGAIVIQEGQVVALSSRKLNPAETRYSATDREHLGLVYAAESLRMILHQSDAPVRVWSDHSALITRRADRLTPRQARWKAVVDAWMPNVQHVKGKDNPADFVSRWKEITVGAQL